MQRINLKILFQLSLALAVFYRPILFGNIIIKSSSQKTMQNVLIHFSKYAEQSRRDWEVPGMAIAIVKDNKIIFAKGFGVRNQQQELVTSSTVFNVGSMTKSFTAALLAKVIELKKFSWDSHVSNLYPDFKLYNPDLTSSFKVIDLLSMHSGLPARVGEMQVLLGYDKDDILHSLQFIKPIAAFNTEFGYQNCFFLVAEKIIEKYTQKSFSDGMREYLLKPLNMHSTVFQLKKLKSKNVAEPFINNHGKIVLIPKDWPYFYWEETYVVAAGLKSNVLDMAKWLMFQINNGRVNGRPILQKSNIELMRSPLTVIERGKNGEIKLAYGEGWFYSDEYAPYHLIFHSGDVTGMEGEMAYIPEERLGVVILTNLRPNQLPDILIKTFFDMYFSISFKDRSKIALNEKRAADKRNLESLPRCANDKIKKLSEYVGVYSNKIYGKIWINEIANQLKITIGPKKIEWYLKLCGVDFFILTWPKGFPELAPDSLIKTWMTAKFIRNSYGKVKQLDMRLLDEIDRSGTFFREESL